MGIFFVYILKSSVCLTMFCLFYKLLSSHDTLHHLNRIALSSSIMLPIIIPFCGITLERVTAIQHPIMDLENLLAVVFMRTLAESASQPVWLRAMVIARIIGGILMLCQLAYSPYTLFQLMRQGTPKLVDGIRLTPTDQPVAPFSWMQMIVIGQKDFKESGIEIMTHEMVHIRTRHPIDLLVSEICILLHWFGLSVQLPRQELQNIHEYEVDENVLSRDVDTERYQLLLIKKAVGAQCFTSTANSFNHSSLKKRIAMMLKRKSSPRAQLRYLYVLPSAALMMIALARPEISHELKKISSIRISEIVPVQEKKKPRRNIEVETLAGGSVVSEKDMQAVQEKVSAVMEKCQPEIDKTVGEAAKAANTDETVSVEIAKHQAEIDKAVRAAIEATKINETIATEIRETQSETNRAIEEAMKAVDTNGRAAKEVSKEKFFFSDIVYISRMESSKERMDNLNPDRIASVNMYKGNGAIAKFGEKGRNGVIEIKLRK